MSLGYYFRFHIGQLVFILVENLRITLLVIALPYCHLITHQRLHVQAKASTQFSFKPRCTDHPSELITFNHCLPFDSFSKIVLFSELIICFSLWLVLFLCFSRALFLYLVCTKHLEHGLYSKCKRIKTDQEYEKCRISN